MENGEFAWRTETAGKREIDEGNRPLECDASASLYPCRFSGNYGQFPSDYKMLKHHYGTLPMTMTAEGPGLDGTLQAQMEVLSQKNKRRKETLVSGKLVY